MTEDWLPIILDWINGGEDTKNDEPFNDFFNENGFQSKLLLKNLGSTIVFLLLYIFIWILTGLLSIIGIWLTK